MAKYFQVWEGNADRILGHIWTSSVEKATVFPSKSEAKQAIALYQGTLDGSYADGIEVKAIEGSFIVVDEVR